jgi:hypothetical protein
MRRNAERLFEWQQFAEAQTSDIGQLAKPYRSRQVPFDVSRDAKLLPGGQAAWYWSAAAQAVAWNAQDLT